MYLLYVHNILTLVKSLQLYRSVFIWVPSLQETSKTFPTTPLPLGYIFSSFMISMMLGSLLYTSICAYSLPSTAAAPQDSSLALHAKLSSLVCAISALTLAISVSSRSEEVRFWAFCVFEACVGMYYPVQGMLRGSLISNDHRATVSSHLSTKMNPTHVMPAILTISRSSQRIRRRIATNWCFLRTKFSHGSELVHARLFVRLNRSHCGEPS